MTGKTCHTAWAKIFIAGPIDVAKHTCRKFCLAEGLCVTVDPTTYIYTGGEEAGVVVGLINYPKFESSELHTFRKACKLAHVLLKEMAQRSVTVQGNYQTIWITNEE